MYSPETATVSAHNYHMASTGKHFLSLPIELRLHIYSFIDEALIVSPREDFRNCPWRLDLRQPSRYHQILPKDFQQRSRRFGIIRLLRGAGENAQTIAPWVFFVMRRVCRQIHTELPLGRMKNCTASCESIETFLFFEKHCPRILPGIKSLFVYTDYTSQSNRQINDGYYVQEYAYKFIYLTRIILSYHVREPEKWKIKSFMKLPDEHENKTWWTVDGLTKNLVYLPDDDGNRTWWTIDRRGQKLR